MSAIDRQLVSLSAAPLCALQSRGPLCSFSLVSLRHCRRRSHAPALAGSRAAASQPQPQVRIALSRGARCAIVSMANAATSDQCDSSLASDRLRPQPNRYRHTDKRASHHATERNGDEPRAEARVHHSGPRWPRNEFDLGISVSGVRRALGAASQPTCASKRSS